MLGPVVNGIGIVGCLLLIGVFFQSLFLLKKKFISDKPVTMEDYVYKIAKVTGESEYDVFCKSAEGWPISRAKIDEDFGDYLLRKKVPYYVNDFVRKNQKHIDELHMPQHW